MAISDIHVTFANRLMTIVRNGNEANGPVSVSATIPLCRNAVSSIATCNGAWIAPLLHHFLYKNFLLSRRASGKCDGRIRCKVCSDIATVSEDMRLAEEFLDMVPMCEGES